MAGVESRQLLKNSKNRGPSIAILEADPAILEYLHRILKDRYNVSLYEGTTELDQGLARSALPDLFLIDWHIAEDEPEEDALALLSRIHASYPTVPIVALACSAELNEVVAAARMGVVDLVLKPFTKRDIENAVQKCVKVVGEASSDGDVKEIPLSDEISFVRTSKKMREIESECALVARADIPVLILGESGTGKEVAAMLIHKLSNRSQHTFLKVNCVAMPADLLESELFGFEQGAFTGAVKSKPGKFELCDRGTIFLDEIGEMPPLLQAKLLQVLQDGSFSRLGGRTTSRVDVRVIAATNIDIKGAIAQKTFREDLYYRLNGFTLKMPPLRERVEEIPLLAQYFMRRMATKSGKSPVTISPAIMQALTNYAWPGNVRELESTIKRYFVLGSERAVIEELGPSRATLPASAGTEGEGVSANLKSLVRNLKGNAESAAIAQTLDATGWNRKAAAKDLQISYKALLYKIKQYNLSPKSKQHRYDGAPSPEQIVFRPGTPVGV
jgi:two-component system, NtrC family, response regulator AtoC